MYTHKVSGGEAMVCLTVKGRLSPTVEDNALVHAPAAMTRCLALKVGPLAVTTVTTAPPGWICTT